MTNLHIVPPTSEPYPTADAYEAACRALEHHRQRADEAEAAIRRVRDLCDRALADPGDETGGDWEDPTPIPGWVTAVERALDGPGQ